MMKTTRRLVLAALAALPLAAPAQAPAAGPPAEVGREAPPPGAPAAQGGATDDGALGPLEGSASAADAGRGTVPPPDTYTIRPGDTLWDLSGRFLNNPWYWPKIWSYNPEIGNPHWIYPGNVLKFYPAAEDAPARVEAAAPVAAGEPVEVEEDDGAPVRELEDLSKANLKEAATAEEREAVSVSGPYKIAFAPSKARHARHDTFVTPRELAESGELAAAFDEKLMLSIEDRAYARFTRQAEVKPGESYLVYKTLRTIRHPVSGELWGYQSVVLGTARVVAVDDKAATVIVKQAYDPIERGALLGPWTEKSFRPVNRRPNRRPLAGRIIATQIEEMSVVGEHHVVFVDRGQADGVEEGNVFTVVRSGDRFGGDPYRPAWDDRLPKEDVANLLVIDVKERASAALVTRSLFELLVGDRVEMRPEPGADAGSGGN
jgi:hypothetical protein